MTKGEETIVQAIDKENYELRQELTEAKRLLKQAVDDISVLLELNDSCYYCKHYVAGECLCVDDCNRSCEWHCTDDALKLLGGSENG